ncbi:methyl-accepting chemotaxis protein [uncultured Thiocystis sp.]|uniref:methyl-accepting chemotaxis protein n=1 Tax=uncultured Thiocystis sp. TaxID=1202134 RepID=UPI0025FFBF02|nr:methyl-accepting chemotaxis protein [uncultured Thiocystis sp.]
MKLGTKLSLGFGLLLFITFLLGLVAILSMERIKSESRLLADEHIPDWDLADEIQKLQFLTGYHLTAFSFNYSDAWLRDGRAALAELSARLERGVQDASETNRHTSLLPVLQDMQGEVQRYRESVDRAEQNVKRVLAAHKQIETQGNLFEEAIVAYRQTQYEAMSQQIQARDTPEELEIRQDRIRAATRILDLSHQILIGTWSAIAARDDAAIESAAENAERLLAWIDELIGVTRQPVNLERLAIVRRAVLDYRASVDELLGAEREGAATRAERIKIYETVLAHANDFIQETKQATLTGAGVTLEGIAFARRVLIGGLLIALLAGIGVALLITRGTLRQLGGEPALAVSIVQRVATGDFSLDIPLRPGDSDSLLAAFSVMLSGLRTLMHRIAAASSQVAAAAEQLSATTEETRAQVRRQQSETDQVATAMNEMTATVEEVARHAASAASAARETDRAANAGGQVVGETIEAIDVLAQDIEYAGQVIARLSEDSQEIGAVLDVIRGVAEQTNLLALNAAIEAARAGEQGRGFAVVAAEVRTLASRTQASIQDIHEKIERVQGGSASAVQAMEKGREKAGRGVEKARLTSDSLRAITRSVTAINDMNTQIASAAEEQSAVAEEINRNLQAIAEVVGQTADGSNQIAAASEELARLAAVLRENVGQFRL